MTLYLWEMGAQWLKAVALLKTLKYHGIRIAGKVRRLCRPAHLPWLFTPASLYY